MAATERPAAVRVPIGASSRVLLTALFFASGAVGLAYEVAWTRGLLRLLGSTAVGSALVLAAFVGGLGLGARWIGRRVEASPRPMALYGALEVGAALWALLVLPLSGWLEGPYAAIATPLQDALRWLLRGLLAALLVVPGAMLLGGTLPAIEKAWTRGVPGSGRALAWLYGINTLGAVAGALLTGFVLIEAFGVFGALLGAAGVGLLVGLIALGVGWRPAQQAPSLDRDLERAHGSVPRGALVAAFLGGLLGMGLELAGFRVLVFFVEGFTVSFAAMVAVWIAGLALGSLLLGPWLVRWRDPSNAVYFVFLATGCLAFGAVLLVLQHLDAGLDKVRAWAYAGASIEHDLLVGQRWIALAGGSALLLAPALLLGASFPLCVRWARSTGAPSSAALGRIYMWSSLGTLSAPLLLTTVLVPWKGALGAWYVLAATATLASSAFGRFGPPRWWRVAPWIGACGLTAFAALLSNVDAALVARSHVLRRHPDRGLLAVGTDEVTTASVISTGEGERTLYTDDFRAAATGPHYRYMRLLGHLPLLLAREQEHVLVICFGTGTTAGAVAAHQGVRRLEVAEVSRAVLDLAPWFEDANRRVLDDPRTRVLVDDGRDALLLHEPDLDVITLEPLMPYSPAGLPFYTREFYELARDRLREGGVVCQWLPVHAMPAAMFAALLRTFFEVFPDGDLWFFEQSCAMTARKGAARPDPGAVRTRFEALSADLADAGYATLDLLASAHVAAGATVLAAPAPDPARSRRTVTDLDPWPEFHATPRGVRTSYLLDTLVYLTTLADGERASGRTSDTAIPVGAKDRDATVTALKARAADAAADGAGSRLERLAHLEDAARLYASALERLPGEAALTWRRARAARAAAAIRVGDQHAKARAARASGRTDDAVDHERAAAGYSLAALALPDGDPVAGQRGAAARLHAVALLRLGRCEAAKQALARAADALLRTAERAVVLEWFQALSTHQSGKGVQSLLPPDLPPCRPEGLQAAVVGTAFDGWRVAVEKRSPLRSVRAAALGLVHAVVEEGAQADLLAALADAPWVEGPVAKAQVALVRARLGDAASLGGLFASEDPAEARAALDESAAAKLMRAVPEASLKALLSHQDAGVREALASALGTDVGPREQRALVDLLSDPGRGVRAAAAAALVPHDADDMQDYDPDGTPESWRKVQERLRRQR